MICNIYNSIPELQKKYGKTSAPPINNLISYIMMENDIMSKAVGLKEQKWCEEREWRKVIELKTGVEVLQHKGKPYCKYYIDKSYLTGITVFAMQESFDNARKEKKELTAFLSDKGYSAKVRVEIL